jgi:hypothetical protein
MPRRGGSASGSGRGGGPGGGGGGRGGPHLPHYPRPGPNGISQLTEFFFQVMCAVAICGKSELPEDGVADRRDAPPHHGYRMYGFDHPFVTEMTMLKYQQLCHECGPSYNTVSVHTPQDDQSALLAHVLWAQSVVFKAIMLARRRIRATHFNSLDLIPGTAGDWVARFFISILDQFVGSVRRSARMRAYILSHYADKPKFLYKQHRSVFAEMGDPINQFEYKWTRVGYLHVDAEFDSSTSHEGGGGDDSSSSSSISGPGDVTFLVPDPDNFSE